MSSWGGSRTTAPVPREGGAAARVGQDWVLVGPVPEAIGCRLEIIRVRQIGSNDRLSRLLGC